MTDATAARHNNLQARLEQILGIGAGQNGYGQGLAGYGNSPSSYQVSNLTDSNLNVISAADINAIYSDMLRARVHQIGTEPTEIAELVSELNLIAEETSNFSNPDGTLSTDPDGNKKGILDFERLMNSIETDKFLLHPSQAVIESAITGTRSNPWNGLIYYEFTVTFNNEDHRRHFFNSGGEIRITSSLNGAPNSKSQDWAELLNRVGTIKMNYNSTQSSVDASGTAIGNYQLTGSYQTVYQKAGQGYTYGIYSGNLYTVKARFQNENEIQFRIEFDDVATGSFIDVNVDGILESAVQLFRASSNYVSVPKPSVSTTTSLSSFSAPLPVYTLSSSTPAVTEGNSVTVILNTINVPDGEVVPYTIAGVTSADISGEPLSGNFVVANNSDSVTLDIASDTILQQDDTEALTVSLLNGSSSVTVNITDATPDPIYVLTATPASVYEGFPITIELGTTNVVAGTVIPYTITGVSENDIDISLTGNFVTDNQGESSITFTTVLDDFEESETLTLTLDNTATSISVPISDALYTLNSSSSSPSEGNTINISLTTNEVPDNTVLPYTITGISSEDIEESLTGTFTVNNNLSQKSFTFRNDAVNDPGEQFNLELDNQKASISLPITDNPLPTSLNRTCIAVIDECSRTQTTMNQSWSQFRSNWPNRPFFLLHPLLQAKPFRALLKEPVTFKSDPLTTYSQVNRDGGSTNAASDWYTICQLDQLPDGSKLALFIDDSGSMRLSTVQASYNLFLQKIQARNMEIIVISNRTENWIEPFDKILN